MQSASPSLPAVAPSGADIRSTSFRFPIPDAHADDLSRLAADLDALLAQRPVQPAVKIPAGATREAALPTTPADDTEDADFDWLATKGPVARALSPGTPDKSAVWLRKAKRQRLAGRLRQAVSWFVTLSIGGAIVALSTYVLLGRMPGFDELMVLSERLWL